MVEKQILTWDPAEMFMEENVRVRVYVTEDASVLYEERADVSVACTELAMSRTSRQLDKVTFI